MDQVLEGGGRETCEMFGEYMKMDVCYEVDVDNNDYLPQFVNETSCKDLNGYMRCSVLCENEIKYSALIAV